MMNKFSGKKNGNMGYQKSPAVPSSSFRKNGGFGGTGGSGGYGGFGGSKGVGASGGSGGLSLKLITMFFFSNLIVYTSLHS